MIPLVTVDQMRNAEQKAIEIGRSETDLMLAAGVSIADEISARHGVASHALVLCGPGKNGGDGVVIATELVRLGRIATVWTYNRDGAGGVPVDQELIEDTDWITGQSALEDALASVDFVVDAVFGAGGRAELPDEVSRAFDAIRLEARDNYLPIWAVDVPSGIDCDTGSIAESALQADVTTMIGLPKVGAYRFPAARNTGFKSLIDIGIAPTDDLGPETPGLITGLSTRRLLPTRRAGLHKRAAGSLMVIGGAPNYYGAPRLAAEAGLRSGAGIVTVAAPSSVIGSIATAVPELTFLPLPVAEHLTAESRMATLIREQLDRYDALVIGPGLGTDKPVPGFLAKLFGFERISTTGIGFGSASDVEEESEFTGRAVIDADGLNWLATRDDWWTELRQADLVLTPHPGELARLLNCERDDIEADPWRYARDAAERFQQVVVLKYGHTCVATPQGELSIAPQAPPSLATAGSGDVLAGLIGGLIAQGLDSADAARAGVMIGLRAVDLGEVRHGSVGLTAGDIIELLPKSIDTILVERGAFE